MGNHFLGKDINKGQNTGIFSKIRGFTFEEMFKRSDQERECVEEYCKYEEYAERAENDIKNFRRMMPNDAAQKFEELYKTCWDKVQVAGLDGSQDEVDFRKKCLETFLSEVIPTWNQDDDDDDDNDDDDEDETIDYY